MLRKLAHFAEFAVLGALLMRAVDRLWLAVVVGSLYAMTDELHQAFVDGRVASPARLDDRHGRRARRRPPLREGDAVKTVAIDLDAKLGDTRPLWDAFLVDAARRFASIAPLDPSALPADRGEAAAALDAWAESGVGDWRRALERFAEDHAPVYLRPDSGANAELRKLKSSGARIVVFTDAPEPLARVAVSHLGLARSIDALEFGAGARERRRSRPR